MVSIHIIMKGDFDLISSVVRTQIQKVRGGGGFRTPQMQNARYPMGAYYTQMTHDTSKLACVTMTVTTVLDVLLVRQNWLLEGTMAFCT